jgi:hypothetical protein
MDLTEEMIAARCREIEEHPVGRRPVYLVSPKFLEAVRKTQKKFSLGEQEVMNILGAVEIRTMAGYPSIPEHEEVYKYWESCMS